MTNESENEVNGGASLEEKQKEYLEIFEKIDREEDGEVYMKEVVDYLKSVNDEMDQNREDVMDEIKSAGWKKFRSTEGQKIEEVDIKSVFRMVDLNRNGTISRTEMKMAFKYLQKRYGINDQSRVMAAMKEADDNQDGKLNYEEFKTAIQVAQGLD